jgi:hypothetical protein
MSDHQNNSESATEKDIEEEIINLQLSVEKLKQRYQQVKTDTARKKELIAEKKSVAEKLAHGNYQDSLKSELNYIQKELAEIELRLESELFKWSDLSEPFWQAVRFMGIGIVIGWILKS